ncbi:MAG: hypothetical protein ACLP19_22470 [Xanthobacteraceae bacterium]
MLKIAALIAELFGRANNYGTIGALPAVWQVGEGARPSLDEPFM